MKINKIKHLKKHIKSFALISIVLAFIITTLSINYFSQDVKIHYRPKNIILIIGDGMGLNHIAVSKEILQVEQFCMETFPLSSYVITSSKKFKTTDSAAAASAMSTGYKTYNGVIAKDGDIKNETLLESANDFGMMTAIITTSPLYDATPAAFTSHTSSRDNIDDIIIQQISSPFDILMGYGKTEYDKYKQEILENNKLYINSTVDIPTIFEKKIICTYGDYDSQYSIDIIKSVQAILNLLNSSAQNGFFLVIENGRIDIASHDNDITTMVQEVGLLDQIVEYCKEFAIENKDTCVIVTADHETGNLKFDTETETISNSLFASQTHTNKLVKLFMYPGDIAEIPYLIDNTYIYKFIYNIISSR